MLFVGCSCVVFGVGCYVLVYCVVVVGCYCIDWFVLDCGFLGIGVVGVG